MYNQSQKIHFVGIGGVGMAGIAEILITLGYQISGSDSKESTLTKHLTGLGAQVFIGHGEGHIPEGTSVVVISSAIGRDNIEVMEAEGRKIPIIPRAEMLAELMRMKYGIAVAGSHGKTSTTSMTSKILTDLGFDPTVIIGGRVLSQVTGANLGSGQYLLAEADESDGSFSFLRPAISVVTNVDSEHMNHYRSFGALEEAFFQFMNCVPFYGLVVYCGDDPVLQRLSKRLTRRSVSYGLSPQHDICALNVYFDGWNSFFTLQVKGKIVGNVTLPMPGLHMVSNSLASIAVSLELGAYPEEIIEALATFPGVARRSEKIAEIDIGESEAVLLIDDYGHHPAEIRATLRGIRNGVLPKHSSQGSLVVLFEPHRYTRTRELFLEFLDSFRDADRVLITDVYAANEELIEGATGEALAAALQHPACSYVASYSEAESLLQEELRGGDVVVTMGAGSIGRYARTLAEILQTKRESDERRVASASF